MRLSWILRSIWCNFHKFNERKKIFRNSWCLLIEYKMNVMKDRSKNMENWIFCYLEFYLMLKKKQYIKEILITSDTQMTRPYGRKQRRTKEPLGESERGEWKSWLKTQHFRKLRSWHPAHHFMANRWGNNGNSDRLYFLGLQNHYRQWVQSWNEKMLAPWKKSYD